MKNNLSLLMGMRRMKITDVYRDTGIARSTLHDLYNEKSENPDTKTIIKLCNYFKVTPNEFLGFHSVDKIKEPQ